MVEKIIVNPEEVRGYGNVLNVHSSTDYELVDCTISSGTDTVNGASATVYTLTPTASHNYSLSFSSSSYTASGGSAEVSVTLTDNSVAVSGATVTFTGGTSTVTGTTNSSGVATATITVTETSTITATYGSATDTCTITVGPTYLFYDSGVTGAANTNYTKTNSNINVSVASTGTTVSSSYYGDCYYYENELISGDFEAEFVIVNVYKYGGIGFLNTSKSRQWTLEYDLWNNRGLFFNKTSDVVLDSDTTMNHTIKVKRVGTSLTVYKDGTQVGNAQTVGNGDGYIGWKTHKDANRSITFKDFSITQL